MKNFDRGGHGAVVSVRAPSRARTVRTSARALELAAPVKPVRRLRLPAVPSVPEAPDASVRLGRVEMRILDEVRRRGGLAPRYALVEHVFPDLGPRPRAGGARGAQRLERWMILRADAESAVSRAIRSLGRKGLLVTERSTQTGRTLLREPGVAALPGWEEMARAEEDAAARSLDIARDLTKLAARARARAISIRTQGSDASVAAERRADDHLLAELQRRIPVAPHARSAAVGH